MLGVSRWGLARTVRGRVARFGAGAVIAGALAFPALGVGQAAPVFIDREPNDTASDTDGHETITGGVLYEGAIDGYGDVDFFDFGIDESVDAAIGLASPDGCPIRASFDSGLGITSTSPTLGYSARERMQVGHGQMLRVEAGVDEFGQQLPQAGPCRYQVIIGPEPNGFAAGVTALPKVPAPRTQPTTSGRRHSVTLTAQLPAAYSGMFARLVYGAETSTRSTATRASEPIAIPPNRRVRVTLPVPGAWSYGIGRVIVAPTPDGPWQTGHDRFVSFPEVATAPFAEGEGRKFRPKSIQLGQSFCSPLLRNINWTIWDKRRARGVARGLVPRLRGGNDSCAAARQRAGARRTVVKLDRRCAASDSFTRITLIRGKKVIYRYTAHCGR